MTLLGAGLAASIVFSCAMGADEIGVTIDVLPGESRNLVDTDSGEPVAVAILGSSELDAERIDPVSLRLLGAPIVKSDAGAEHLLEDVNGDGALDLVVWFSPHDLRLSDSDTTAVLFGTTRDGVRLSGRDAIRTLTAERRGQSLPRSTSEEKLPSLDGTVADLSQTLTQPPVEIVPIE